MKVWMPQQRLDGGKGSVCGEESSRQREPGIGCQQNSTEANVARLE